MTDKLVPLLVEHEGEKLYAYPDSEGWLTIGVGHLIDKRLGGVISKEISRAILNEDLARALDEARLFGWFDNLDDVRQDVIVMLIFNMGRPRLLGFKEMLAAIAAQDWEKAANELADSRWANQVQRDRKIALCKALLSGTWD